MAPGSGLSRGTMLAYCFFRLPLSPIDFTVRMTARTTIWIDTLKMQPSTQAMLVAGVKSFDFLLGFIVGKASDNTRSKYGRRRPFICIAFPIGLTCLLLFCNASVVLGSLSTSEGEAPFPCIHLVGNASSGPSCPALKACLDEAIADGTIYPPTNTSTLAGRAAFAPERPGGGAILYFVLTYFGFIFGTWTATQIPYDALGMELTDDYDARSKLFGVKTFFQFIGYLFAPIVGIILQLATNNLVLMTTLRSIIFVVLGATAHAILILRVKERKVPQEAVQVPIIPSAMRTFSNGPYLQYLKLRVPITLFSLIPANLVSYFIKYTMALEDWTFTESLVLIVVLFSGLFTVPASVRLANKIGKAKALFGLLAGVSVFMLVFTFIGYHSIVRAAPWLVYIICIGVGIGTVLAFGLPDAILNDVIDYDELRTGERNEGMYTVIETNLQQFVEIAGGVIPLMVLSAAGFEPLAGCSCGCGIPCTGVGSIGMPYARWVCPNNVGYTCTGEIGSELLYANEPAVPPCADQSEGVMWVIILFLLFIPGLCGLLAAYFAVRQPITKEIHAQIREALDNPGAPRIDPFTKQPIVLPDNSDTALVRQHYTSGELVTADGPDGIKRLTMWLYGRLALSMGVSTVLLVIMGVTGLEYVVTIGCLFLAVLVVMVPWDSLRLRILLTKGGTVAAGEVVKVQELEVAVAKSS